MENDSKRRRTSEAEKKAKTAARKRQYDRKRVYLGDAWEEWERQRKIEGFESQISWAHHLLAVNQARCMYMATKPQDVRYHTLNYQIKIK